MAIPQTSRVFARAVTDATDPSPCLFTHRLKNFKSVPARLGAGTCASTRTPKAGLFRPTSALSGLLSLSRCSGSFPAPLHKGPPSRGWRRFRLPRLRPAVHFAPSTLSRSVRSGSRPTPHADARLCCAAAAPAADPGQPVFPASARLLGPCPHPAAPPHVHSVRSKPSAGAPPRARPGLPVGPAAGGCPPDPTSGSSSGPRPGRGLLPLTTDKAALSGCKAGGTEVCSRCGVGKR